MLEYAPLLHVSYYAQTYAGIIRQGLIEMLHSVGSNVYTCLHRTVNNPQLPLYAFIKNFDACCIMGDNALGDNFARGCGGG